MSSSSPLPRPGPLWGPAPQRDDTAAPPWRWPHWSGAARHCAQVAAAARDAAAFWATLGAGARADALRELRAGLRRHGFGAEQVAQALGCVAATAASALGRPPFETQLFAAAALLDNRMAEMATGEGKTLAAALAAAVAALAGVPVHVVTANHYLAARDAQSLQPLYAALGLRCAHLAPTLDPDGRRDVYGHDIVYATASALAFDHLRDRLAQAALPHDYERRAAALAGSAAPPMMMRGLCMAILDEADSILLDEADVPLILSRAAPQAARRAFLWQALAIARQLEIGLHFELAPAGEPGAHLTPQGDERVALLAAPLGGPWRRPRYRAEAVTLALAGLHGHRRGEHYLVRDGKVEILDAVSGRIAAGRVWSRGLHTVIEMKEGCTPSPDTETLAQITFQRFFLRYLRLAGTSGTLREARRELRQVYGAGMVRVPRQQPWRCEQLPPQRFGDPAQRWAAVAARAAELRDQRRPVLIGTDSVADSLALSAVLSGADLPHQVLNALQDEDEARIVSLAGQAGRITVATRMAGRGTDIALDERALAAGGLHVINCQHNPSHRLDRQLAGRAARQGDPGSAETWFLARSSGFSNAASGRNFQAWDRFVNSARQHAARVFLLLSRWLQWREEARRRALRRELLRQDRAWQRRLSFTGPES